MQDKLVSNHEDTELTQNKEILMTNKTIFSNLFIFFSLVLTFTLTAATVSAADKKEIKEEKAEIRKMVNESLAQLYKLQPSAKKAVSNSAGYAVFSNFGTKIFVVGGGAGKGLLKDNKGKKETFMKMVELQTGIGLGVKKFRLVWVFENHKDVSEFVTSGWEFGGQTTAAAKAGDEGGAFAGAISISPGIWLYQMTDTGLALEATVKGTKYYKDDDLN